MGLVYGIGIYEKGRHPASLNNRLTKPYKQWSSMLHRCYSPLSLRDFPTYKDVTVSGIFLEYQLFAEWFCDNYTDGWRLDKDILIPGNKIYQDDRCCFVPHIINAQLNHCRVSRGEFPAGVSFDRRANKYSSKISRDGVTINLGLFDSPDLARAKYLSAKKDQMKNLADQFKAQLSPEIYSAICNYPVEVDFHAAP